MGALRNVSLKQVREAATQWRSVFRKGRNLIKERDKQKPEVMRSHFSQKHLW
ncbi:MULTISPECIES: hypothetical protein [unclassified Bartonella]|uniref:hypothetical protein n=1 Tax=unclassified Bartonella TaxID=2645622 RepID=UPI0035D11B07